MKTIAIILYLAFAASLLIWAFRRKTPQKNSLEENSHQSSLKKLRQCNLKENGTHAKEAAGGKTELTGDGSYSYEVVGESHYQLALLKLAGPKNKESKKIYLTATIEHDKQNKHDQNACAVYIANKKVGHLPKQEARKMLKKLGAGFSAKAKAVIVGGWKNQKSEGDYGVLLDFSPHEDEPATILQKEMYHFFNTKIPHKLNRKQVAEQEEIFKRDQRMSDWLHCVSIIEYLQSRDGRDEFEIPRIPASKIRKAFQTMQSEGYQAEKIESEIDVLVDAIYPTEN